jgi:RNA polymerase sigma-70 factor (sigma-E family)
VHRPSLGELYEIHSPGALRLAYVLSGDRELAQDLVQDAFVRLFARYQDLRDAAHFEAYLRKTIINLSKDQRRRKRTERVYLSRQDSREMAASATDRDEELHEALLKLPERQRAAVALRYLEDLSEHQTADAMDTSVAAIKALTQRGSAALRRHLGGEAP